MISQGEGLKRTEINGGRVQKRDEPGNWRLSLPPARYGYANAQLDDYQHDAGLQFLWRPGVRLVARVRFSPGKEQLVGTAGFGFWNAPFGPGTGFGVRLPRALWFFYASKASNLPLAPAGETGNGWFASTIDVRPAMALRWTIFGLPTLVLNQMRRMRRILWPIIRRDLGIGFERARADTGEWHEYEICWRRQHVLFRIDRAPLFMTPFSPRGPLGLVMWIDNQALVATPTGRLSWKTEPGIGQAMEISEFHLETCE